MTPLFYTFTDMGQALGLVHAEAVRNRIRLMEAQGMPPRLPGHPPRWSKPAVDRWLAHWSGPVTSSIPPVIPANAGTGTGELEGQHTITHLQHHLTRLYSQRREA